MIETWGGGNRRTRGKASKLDIIRDISNETHTKSLDIGTLNISDLKAILIVVRKDGRIQDSIPDSKLKAPYLDALNNLLPKIPNLRKLTVASLKALTGALSDVA